MAVNLFHPLTALFYTPNSILGEGIGQRSIRRAAKSIKLVNASASIRSDFEVGAQAPKWWPDPIILTL